MKLPLSMIKSLIRIDLPVQQIADGLTLLGIEVDRVYNEAPSFARVVVGEVVSARRHPNGEKLQVAEVSDGRSVHTVVCAAPNCRPGIKVPFAPIGAALTDSHGHILHIEKTAIRGVESHGMLCSAQELKLPLESAPEGGGILELPVEMPAGQDLASVLWDPVFELSLTPNLGHCMSALGVARELAALYRLPLSYKKADLEALRQVPSKDPCRVSVADPRLCPRYMGRLIQGVRIAPSPFWLRQQLEAAGVKPIHNAVDVANYIMLKFGQPMHAFDFDRLDGAHIEVAPAQRPLPFVGLDGVEREIPPGTLLISDAKKPVAIAGILGGENSAIAAGTTNLFLEAAVFDPAAIRTASKKMALRTDSSHRFEKGIDPSGVEEALDQACSLILALCGGRLASGKIDVKHRDFTPKEIDCRIARVNRILGTRLSFTEIEEIFHRLSFKTRALGEEVLRVQIPSYRTDIAEEIDLVEEVARIYGYPNIEKSVPLCSPSQIPHDPDYLFEKEVRTRLLRLGLQEFLSCDLISPKLAEISQEIASTPMIPLQTVYSKSEEYSVLRISLLPGMLQAAKRNIDQKNNHFASFEIGRIHFLQKAPQQLVEQPMGAILWTGKRSLDHWSQKSAEADLFDLKGLIETLCAELNIAKAAFQPSQHLSFHPGRQADLLIGGTAIGSLGEVHPSLLEKFDIKQRVLFAEWNLALLRANRKTDLKMAQLPQFPASERDWTISLAPSVPIAAVFQAIRETNFPLLEHVQLIDLYQPEASSQKNATFRFTYRDRFKTISFEEAEAEHARLIQAVSSSLHL